MSSSVDTRTESRRPALERLTFDIGEMRTELLRGFDSRRDILEWGQRLTIRTLGELPDEWYEELARQFRGEPDSEYERTLLAALINDWWRKRPLDPDAAEEFRERLYAVTIQPAFHAAFRKLRKDAGEYIDTDEAESAAGHDAQRQKYVAMRPAINELEHYQESVLADVLDGFDERGDILEWGDEVELATHGEIEPGFIPRCYGDESVVRMLTSDERSDQRARELFAAYYLLPAFNAGVRDLAGRTSEQPAEQSEPEAPFAT